MKAFLLRGHLFLKKWLAILLNPRLLLCLLLAWCLTNGWSYALLFLGLTFGIGWMSAIGSAYIGFLWFPFTPEKLLTITIALFLLRLLFPNDQKTLHALRIERDRLRERWRHRRSRDGEQT